MFNILEIKQHNKELLDTFIVNNIFPNTFRYFNKRTSDIISYHLITLLLMDNETPVGYAHIDFDCDKHWFGICILDKYQGKGYGKMMMQYIFNNEKVKNIDKIYLTVDKVNNVAIKLYEKYDFNIINEKNTYFTMVKNKSS
jgi:ribosomal protein S18 acetylase RimI-like enzyme